MTNHANMSACAELDRENAHFSVSEAMIAAIEEAKFSEWVAWLEDRNDDRLMAEDVDAESDEEVFLLIQWTAHQIGDRYK